MSYVYKGKNPKGVKTITGLGNGKAIIETFDGNKYELEAKKTKGLQPRLGENYLEFLGRF